MRVLYGKGNRYNDVTEIAQKHCLFQGGTRLIIPPSDYKRDHLFGDPWYGIEKDIIVQNEAGEERIYGPKAAIDVDITKPLVNKEEAAELVLSRIHRSYPTFAGHLIHDEYPEQVLAVMYIDPADTVLELGGNVGRNTLTISRILDDSSRLVVLETMPDACDILRKNKEVHGLDFHIVNAALSYRKLVQKNWITVPCDDGIPLGYTSVATVTFEDLQSRFPSLSFTTLVADVEGALYYVLQDNPAILTNLKTLILENDYGTLEQKRVVEGVIRDHGFTCVYTKMGGWGPCFPEFYEVWQKL